MADKIAEGKPAPNFSLPSTENREVSLSEFKGKKAVVLYFYPKDDTPGCTREACDFRDSLKKFGKEDAVVLGVSADPLDAHEAFREKYKLPFPLLSDGKREVLKAYGVWKEKSFYGRKFMGIERTTVVIGRDGRVRKIFPKVKVDGHVDEVLAACQG